ncbi:MAG: hypothetical protein FWH49_03810, partial [Clostridiales bacterium]|nr:hypothetical protein [Clostridiales bacterium]
MLLNRAGNFTFPLLILSIAAAYPAGGAQSACLFCLTRMLSDDPAYTQSVLKRKFRENLKLAAAPGMLYTAFVYAQLYLWGPLLAGAPGGVMAEANLALAASQLLSRLASSLVVGMVAPYLFLVIAYIDLPLSQILKSSLLLSFAKAPRSFMGAVTGGSVWLAFALFLPTSLAFAPLLLLFGFPLSWLLTLLWIWPPVDKQFAIE